MKTHPSNKFNYCPSCGSKNIGYHKGDYFLCDDCNFTYHINMGGAVAAIILNNKEEILFTVRAKDPGKGTLDLPGGFIDLHERAEDAVIREIKEELDLDISELTYFTSFPNHYVYKDFSYFTIDLCFICKVNSFKDIKSLDDVVDFKFIPLEEINTEDIGLASIRKMLTMYKEQKQTLKA